MTDVKRERVYLKIAPEKIDFLNRIMEGYEYLGVVTTVSGKEGRIVIQTTPGQYDDVLLILNNLPFPVQIMGDIENSL